MDAGHQPGHEELLELLEKDLSSTKQSTEVDLPPDPEEVGSNSPQLNNPVGLNEEQHDDEVHYLVEGNNKRGSAFAG